MVDSCPTPTSSLPSWREMTRCFPILTLRPKYSFPRLPRRVVLRSREVWPSVGEHCQGGAIRNRQGDCLSRSRCCTGIREIKTAPEEEGAPLPENDIWIAAAAKCHE